MKGDFNLIGQNHHPSQLMYLMVMSMIYIVDIESYLIYNYYQVIKCFQISYIMYMLWRSIINIPVELIDLAAKVKFSSKRNMDYRLIPLTNL